MTDIVERLREWAGRIFPANGGYRWLVNEAADEIERLRAELAERHEGGAAMTDLRKAAASLLSAVDLALPYAPHRHEFDRVADTAEDLRAALAAEQAPDAEAVRAEVEALRNLLHRARPIIDADASMMADITRHAPLPPEAQAIHDSTEYESERLAREIRAAMTRAQKGE